MDSLHHLLIDFHLRNPRQGPGGRDFTRKALEFLNLEDHSSLQIADLGCGCGAQTLDLAEHLSGTLYAIDLFPQFLEELSQRALKRKLRAKVEVQESDMAKLAFSPYSLDIIWAESSIYNIGFKAGLTYWQKFLKPGGYMVISELSWLRDRRPRPLEEHWKLAYPGIQNIAGNIQTIYDQNLVSLAHFGIDEDAWRENYYQKLENSFEAFMKRHNYSPEAQSMVEAEITEIKLYERYKDYYNYVFYLIRKPL